MSTSVPEVADGIRPEAEEFTELLRVYSAMGDPERIITVGGHGAGYAVKPRINQLWFSHHDHGDCDEGFAIAIARQELGLSIGLARSVGAPSELSTLVEQAFGRARRSYGDLTGEMTPFNPYEDLIGTELRLPGEGLCDCPTALTGAPADPLPARRNGIGPDAHSAGR